MSKVNYSVLNDSIVLNFQGKTDVISASDKRYAKVIEHIRAGTLDEIPAAVSLEQAFEGSGLTLRDGKLWDGEAALPDALTARILKFRDMELPYGPLLNFWANLKKNPSFNSRQMLYKFLEHNGHPLTEDGCFIAYRGVAEDFKDKHTGKFDNSPGQKLSMARDQVDDNPNNTCSNGFHAACFGYARGFGEKMVEVKINPEHVVAVPVDYHGTKMRVCEFEVVQECETIRTEEVYNNPNSVYKDESEEESDEFETCSDCGDEVEETNAAGLCHDCGENCCEECGEERSPFANFCGECGAEF